MAEHRQDPLQPDLSGRDSDAGDALPDRGPPLHRIELGPNAAAEALRLVRAFADDEGCGTGPALAIIVEELVLNLVDHGIATVADLALGRSPEGIRLTLIDDGPAFDPRDAAEPGETPPERGGGAGLALVRAWSRDLAYRQVCGGNRLDLLVPFAGA